MQYAKRNTYRGAVVAKVAVCLPLIGAFMALSVDMGYITATQSDLVRAADASCLAAVLELAVPQNEGTSLAALHARAVERANGTLQDNPTLGVKGLRIGSGDVELGYAEMDPDRGGRYSFTSAGAGGPDAERPNAVALTLGESDGNSLSLFFARILGISASQPKVRAVAALSPRAVAIVFDNSTHMYHDSQLQHQIFSEAGRDPDLRTIWEQVFNRRTWGLMNEFDTFYPLRYRGVWLTHPNIINHITALAGGNPLLDPAAFADPDVRKKFFALASGSRMPGFGGSDDRDITDDGRTVWHQRLAVGLDLADWDDENGDFRLDSDEIDFKVNFPGQSDGEGWYDYFDFLMQVRARDDAGYYVFDEDSPLSEAEQRERMLGPLEIAAADPRTTNYTQQFGIQTLVSHLLFDQPSGPFVQAFVDTTVEPRTTGATVVRDAVDIFAKEFKAPIGSEDHIAGDALGLVTFDGGARSDVKLTREYTEGADRTDPDTIPGALREAAIHRNPKVLDRADLESGIREATAMLTDTDNNAAPELGIVREMVIVTVGWANVDTNGGLKYLHVGHKFKSMNENDAWSPREMPVGCFEGPEQAIREAHGLGIAVSIVSLCDIANKPWFNYLKDEGIIADWINVCGGGDDDRQQLRQLLGKGRIPFLIQ